MRIVLWNTAPFRIEKYLARTRHVSECYFRKHFARDLLEPLYFRCFLVLTGIFTREKGRCVIVTVDAAERGTVVFSFIPSTRGRHFAKRWRKWARGISLQCSSFEVYLASWRYTMVAASPSLVPLFSWRNGLNEELFTSYFNGTRIGFFQSLVSPKMDGTAKM